MGRAHLSESSFAARTGELLQRCAREARVLLGIGDSIVDAGEILGAINRYVVDWQRGRRPPGDVTDFEDSRLCMASLWGEQLRTAFGWEWAWVTFHDHGDSKALGVFSEDRSMAIYPFEFLLGCMRDGGVAVTIELAFELLRAGRIPKCPPRAYENVMAGVCHIVPPPDD